MKSSKKISRIITVRLFVTVFAAFLVSSVLSYFVLSAVSEVDAYDIVQQRDRKHSLQRFVYVFR